MTHPIPAAALTQHIAILGKTGSGKSYTAQGIAEELLGAGERVCIIDPTGRWWGLRSSASGKGTGFPVVVFGGSHADVPLAETHGETLAEIIGTSNTPAILDTRQMTVGGRTRFFADFAEALLRKNKGPLTLIIDEAHLFAPQGRVNDPQSGKMLHAANNLVSLGRGIGLRIILITQRPAKLHKDSLTQAETLVALRLIAPQDRRAVEDWIGEWADPKEAKELLGSLPSLPTGTGWIWAPELGVLKKATFPKIKTYDSGKAPADGDGAGPVLAAIDVPAIQARLGKVAEDAKANDPKALKAEIADLRRQLVKADKANIQGAKADPAEIEKARRAGLEEGIALGFAEAVASLRNIKAKIDKAQAELTSLVMRAPPPVKPTPARVAQRIERPNPSRQVGGSNPPARSNPPAEGITSALQRVLDAIAWWRKIGQHPVERSRAAVVAGYSPKASTFGVYIADLVKRGLVYSEPGRVGLTDEGLRIAKTPEASTREELRDMARSLLKPQEQRVFDVIYDAFPAPMLRASVAEAVGLSPTASTAGVYIATVAGYGLIEPDGRGQVKAAGWLFP